MMGGATAFGCIKALAAASRDGYTAELHIQIIKHADELVNLSGREFCEALGIGVSFGTEFAKMRKIAPRLRSAGLDVSKL
ncbi:HTH-like domain-containing protein [Xanthobacter agilis]|uniref:HTH-like domain-containing protein n=2 Tax=Xanthobacter agilis TaxID=47492 RepID=UPI00372AECA5